MKSATGTTSTSNVFTDTLFGKADMGSLVPFDECGKAIAVSVTSFHPDLVAET